MANPHPDTWQISCMFDVGSWANGHIEEINNHTKSQCFKFVRNESGKAVMFYRKWSHEEWMGPTAT